MPKSDVIMIRAKLESATPDRTQYKPYAPTLTFENVFVDIPVPADYIRKEGGNTRIVLDVDGMAIALDVVATAIENMNNRWTKSKQNPSKNYNPLKIEP